MVAGGIITIMNILVLIASLPCNTDEMYGDYNENGQWIRPWVLRHRFFNALEKTIDRLKMKEKMYIQNFY